MKRVGNIWPEIVTFENIYRAYLNARRGKRRRYDVAQFSVALEPELFRLLATLKDQSYEPGEYRLLTIYERKPRQIAIAPFCDRVVHHTLMNVVEPRLDVKFIDDSYACRRGKGTHAAVNRYQQWSQHYRYALKMDIQRYFPSVDRCLLKQTLRRYLKDPQALWLFDTIIEHAPASGLPIGNLTSQFLANLYLDGVDHFIKEKLRVKAYLRYVDDFVILGQDKAALWHIQQQVADYLATLNLTLHPNKSHIFPTALGIDLLGYRVFPYKRLLRNDSGHRFAKRMRKVVQAHAAGRMSFGDINCQIGSWLGHAKQADTQGLRQVLLSAIVL